jgi:hypothetical protein
MDVRGFRSPEFASEDGGSTVAIIFSGAGGNEDALRRARRRTVMQEIAGAHRRSGQRPFPEGREHRISPLESAAGTTAALHAGSCIRTGSAKPFVKGVK